MTKWLEKECIPGILERALENLAQGETVSQIARDLGITRQQLDVLLHKPENIEQFNAARRTGCDAIAEECMRIADEAYETDEDGKIDGAQVHARKLQIHTRMQLIAKWHKAKYGETITHRGDAEAPLVTRNVSTLTDAELMQIAAAGKLANGNQA